MVKLTYIHNTYPPEYIHGPNTCLAGHLQDWRVPPSAGALLHKAGLNTRPSCLGMHKHCSLSTMACLATPRTW